MRKLSAYLESLEELGRAPGTLELYAIHVEQAYAHPDGVLGRVTDKQLASTTRRTAIAILKGYAQFAGDQKLVTQLRRIKRPSDQRAKARPPLTTEEWRGLRDGIESSESLEGEQRAVLGLMATRGFRVGDVLRLKRREVTDAIRTGKLVFLAKGDRRLRFTTNRILPFLEALKEFRGWETVAELVSPDAEDPHNAARQLIQRKLKVVAEEVGLNPEEIYTHRLRRTYAIEFLKAAKGDINKLRLHMGWQSVEMAARYVDYIEDDEMDAIADLID